jgi:hypothetical protein
MCQAAVGSAPIWAEIRLAGFIRMPQDIAEKMLPSRGITDRGETLIGFLSFALLERKAEPTAPGAFKIIAVVLGHRR